MDKLRLLIADAAEDFRADLMQASRDSYFVQSAKEGHEALSMLQSFMPNVMVLDMMLPGLDGISLLQKAADLEIRPVVLATTRMLSDYMSQALERMGVGYVMVKPCDAAAVVARLGDLTQSGSVTMFSNPDPRVLISNVLRDLGIPTKLRGYGYLREAIEAYAKDPGQSITKELYCAVGERYHATVTQVERGIRTAIEYAWEHRDSKAWQRYFTMGERVVEGRPTNGAFVSCIADHLSMELRGS